MNHPSVFFQRVLYPPFGRAVRPPLIASLALLCLFWTDGQALAESQSRSYDLAFETTNQGMWGPGATQTFQVQQEIINVPWDVGPLNIGGITPISVPELSTTLGTFEVY